MSRDAPTIVNLADDGLIPYELDGPEYAGLIEWRPISYDEATETGTYFFRMHPGAETAPHTHRGWEEFYVIEGEAIESGGRTIRAGDFVSFAPGTTPQHPQRDRLPADRDRAAAAPGRRRVMAAPLPALPYADWSDTKDTLHLWTQIAGKIRLASTPPQNHWWNVPLYLDARGLTTRRLRATACDFDIGFDFVDHRLAVRTSRGELESFALHDGLSVRAFHDALFTRLHGLGIDVEIRSVPFGVPSATPFAEDDEHCAYDARAVERYWAALSWIDWTFQEFAGWYCGKTSPVHLFWHSFDLAVTRFSGRRAPANPTADAVTQEAYSHEAISFGFWAGDPNTPHASFYSYTAPEPAGLTGHPLAAGAEWTAAGSGSLALLPYESVRTSADPRATLLAFLQSAYEAGTAAAGWPVDDLRSSWCPPG